MRDEFKDEYHAAEEDTRLDEHGRLPERLSTWFGAGLAVLLIGVLVFWGYWLGQRDASAIPVIRAALNPVKMQPDDPGGAVIAHQDIASYSAGEAEADRSQVSIAPPPQRPSEEDVTMGALREDAGETVDGTTQTSTGNPELSSSGNTDESTASAPVASPVAQIRPADLSRRREIAQQTADEDTVLASRAAISAVQIQLGAYPDRELAKTEWNRIYRANEDILYGRARVVQSTISGGRRFFRLRAGPFKSRVEAQNVCRALQARGQDCLVAVNG